MPTYPECATSHIALLGRRVGFSFNNETSNTQPRQNIHSPAGYSKISLDPTSYKLYYVNYKMGLGFRPVHSLCKALLASTYQLPCGLTLSSFLR
jgi:hypothetical protein